MVDNLLIYKPFSNLYSYRSLSHSHYKPIQIDDDDDDDDDDDIYDDDSSKTVATIFYCWFIINVVVD